MGLSASFTVKYSYDDAPLKMQDCSAVLALASKFGSMDVAHRAGAIRDGLNFASDRVHGGLLPVSVDNWWKGKDMSLPRIYASESDVGPRLVPRLMRRNLA